MKKMTVIGAGVALAMVLSACGDDEGSGSESAASKPAAAAAAPQSVEVKIASFKYVEEKVEVAKGGTVTFKNFDKAPHTATAEDESFDTDRLNTSQSGKITFDKPGTYRYYCVYHRFMEADVVVK